MRASKGGPKDAAPIRMSSLRRNRRRGLSVFLLQIDAVPLLCWLRRGRQRDPQVVPLVWNSKIAIDQLGSAHARPRLCPMDGRSAKSLNDRSRGCCAAEGQGVLPFFRGRNAWEFPHGNLARKIGLRRRISAVNAPGRQGRRQPQLCQRPDAPAPARPALTRVAPGDPNKNRHVFSRGLPARPTLATVNVYKVFAPCGTPAASAASIRTRNPASSMNL